MPCNGYAALLLLTFLVLATGCVSSGPPSLAALIRPSDRQVYARHLEAADGDPREAFYRWKSEETGRPVEAIAAADRRLAGDTNPFDPGEDELAVRRGALFYEIYCLTCHGVDADGRGPSQHAFLPRMDFHRTSRRFAADYFPSTPGRWFQSVAGGKVSESEVLQPDGSPHAMPAFGEVLAREQIWLAVTYLLSSSDDRSWLNEDARLEGSGDG